MGPGGETGAPGLKLLWPDRRTRGPFHVLECHKSRARPDIAGIGEACSRSPMVSGSRPQGSELQAPSTDTSSQSDW